MPTTKRRIALTVPDDIDTVLTQISELSGIPKTALIVDLLQDALPMMQQGYQALQEVKSGNKGAALDLMAAQLKDAGFILDEAQHDFFDIKKKEKHDKTNNKRP